ncbi:amidohydrolase family protein [Haloquadratum walsbyi]|jgi:Cytosine deaminase and related metal-dependent hydrolases|uniref:Cytosine deaminase related metal-dependent hydrolase n=1 Tax=Haloquadratum walsbyi J07HQW2 TaxID=1238425 RepID=U1PTP1_9EURY|nr:amidohydrolase family protein [Haloquadratum walsbyi]ERG97172.1 MAG: cytosine deaminase related metal-dependent hydrolase [Haloquadratum walsbyi J07HQW2]
MSKYIVRNGTDRSGNHIDVAIKDDEISDISSAGEVDASDFELDEQFDAEGSLITPTFSEPHTHLDSALTIEEARVNDSGTVEEGWEIWASMREELTKDTVKRRARQSLEWFLSNGVTRVRTHADVTAVHWHAIEALLELREEFRSIDLEIVAFPIDSVVDDPETLSEVEQALDMGVDIVGGLPHKERTRERGVEHVRKLVDIAEEYDARMDFHIDETDDPQCRYTEVLVDEVTRRDIGSRATASHVTALHSYPNTYASKLIHELNQSDVSVVTNPLANAIIQGRYDDYPKRRGYTRVEELRQAGVTVGIGQDDLMDSTYQYGDGDPLTAAHMLVHFAQLNLRRDVDDLWDMLTYENADIFGADDYGLNEGDEGSLIVFDSADPFTALRTRRPRKLVIKDGCPVAKGTQSVKVCADNAWTDVTLDVQ